MPDALVKSSKVAQWGHSAAVRLSSATLERAAFRITDEIEIVAGEGEIIIRHPRPRVRLDDLLAKFDPAKHRHELMLDDEPIGIETR